MQVDDVRRRARESARAYAQVLDATKRKRLGQYFTGVRLGKLLAHLALRPETRTVLDPMAGHGDLLDATCEAAAERGIPVERLDGIEIDDATAAACRQRLTALISSSSATDASILASDAFDSASAEALPTRGYDLVITNPPYVRYQRRKDNGAAPVRAGLAQIVDKEHSDADREIWRVLTQSYSGLADLSVPACVLAGYFVRPGGRLALVVPATWRSRDYSDVIRYLFLRCFALETIVADSQPGWFSDALVRTHLIIARRLSSGLAQQPVGARERWTESRWVRVAPDAADERSLVGAAFGGEQPEAAFATWVAASAAGDRRGIEVSEFGLRHEWESLRARIGRRRWYATLESRACDLPLFTGTPSSAPVVLPNAIRDMLPSGADTAALVPLEEAGIKVGQGLRTGCNAFFYVTACGTVEDGSIRVKASPGMGGMEFSVPSPVLKPVLRRQAEIRIVERGEAPPGRVLDLRAWVLPEDAPIVTEARAAYSVHRVAPPKVMPTELAAFVRRAANVAPDGSPYGKAIPSLSAVRTNVRRFSRNGTIPRFWYMLPDFAARHLPAVYAARVNQDIPWIECNTDPPLLIDANFSTFWVPNGAWSRFALKALLNSVWCRGFMEASGTPLGGGALKLEATHLRQMPVPVLATRALAALDAAGRILTRDGEDVQEQIDRIVLEPLLPVGTAEASVENLAHRMTLRMRGLRDARQRTKS